MALLMVFVLSTLLIAASLQLLSAPTIAQYLGNSSSNSLSAQELALFGMDVVMADMQAKLNAGETVDENYTYPVTQVSMPGNPSQLSTLDNLVGSYSGSITKSRGATYVLKVNALVGGASYDLYKLLQMENQVPAYDCNVVESQIFAGNIASISDNDLKAYAQHDCMIKTGSATVSAPNAGSGSTACGDKSGSGTLDMTTINCAMTITGTYGIVQLNNAAANSGKSYSASGTGKAIYSYPSSGSRVFHVPGTVYADNKLYAISGVDGTTKSTRDHTFLFNTVSTTSNSFQLRGGDGNDVFSFNGNSNSDIYTNGGNNVIMISGIFGSSTLNAFIGLGDDGSNGGSYKSSTGANMTYIDTIMAGSAKTTWILNYSSGSSQIYFKNITGAGNIYLNGLDSDTFTSNDIIACGVSVTGGVPSCGTDTHTGNLNIYGQNGSDIISLDFLPAAKTYINGNYPSTTETTANIIYTKGCSGTTTIQTNNTKSLVISAGNRASGCTINGQGGNSVLLKKSGTTDSGTNSNFGRTITY